ncbi:hypothetical protein WMY93_026225 [Mugilogobius chulae]|uniref:Uncharacterized protein n=1 Tax=Mugilogobius chulae TaxID=88201 RepID=A0AAW0MXV6_9GOBI
MFSSSGRYMTFSRSPPNVLLPSLHDLRDEPSPIPSITRLGRQLDFHEFSNTVAPYMFGYSPHLPERVQDLRERALTTFKLLQGHHLTPLSESMMRNLLLVFREDYLEPAGSEWRTAQLYDFCLRSRSEWKTSLLYDFCLSVSLEAVSLGVSGPLSLSVCSGSEWRTAQLYDFCLSVSLEATFMTLYGRSASRHRHQNIPKIKENFVTFDRMIPMLIAQVPLWLLGRTKHVRQKLIDVFSSSVLSEWSDSSEFIQRRRQLFDQYNELSGQDKAGGLLIDQYKAGTLLIDQYKAGTLLIDQYKAGTLLIDQYKAGTLLIDQYKAGRLLIDQYKTGTLQIDQYKAGTLLIDQYKTGTLQIDQYKAGVFLYLLYMFQLLPVAFLRSGGRNRGNLRPPASEEGYRK